jgi:hypothetical protein
MTHAPSPEDHAGHLTGPGYETRDAGVSPLLKYGGGLVVALVVIDLAMLGLFRLFITERPVRVEIEAPENLYQQLRDLRRGEDGALGGYGWVDRTQGVVHIPIDRAIELVAAKGVRFGKGPKSEIEMNSHAGSPAPAPGGNDAANPTSPTGSKP